MKGKVLFFLGLIVIVHVVVIYMFIGGDKPKSAPPPPKQPIKDTASPIIPDKQVPSTTDLNLLDEKKPPPKPLHDNPLFGYPLKYDYAIMGDIPALPGSKSATTGILVDLDSRYVIWAKKPRNGVPIASMTKMMTMLLAMEDLRDRDDVSLNTNIQVTREAMLVGGSQVYLDVRESFPLGELLKTVAIKSANDSSYLVAQYLGGGDVDPFVARMNKRARSLLMPNTHFYNPHGLPGTSSKTDNISSPEGMVMLAEHLLEFRQAMDWAATWEASFRDKDSKAYQRLINHNHLVMTRPGAGCPGVDGLKTGFIQRAGFCITVTCKRGDRRLVAVVTGFSTSKERDKFVRALLDWGYTQHPERKARKKADIIQK